MYKFTKNYKKLQIEELKEKNNEVIASNISAYYGCVLADAGIEDRETNTK